jgi:hypothetical protein
VTNERYPAASDSWFSAALVFLGRALVFARVARAGRRWHRPWRGWGVAVSAALVAGLLCTGPVFADPQGALRHTSFGDFQSGEAERVAVLGTGGLELGPAFGPFEAFRPQAMVWALAADSTGRVYAATGHAGKVFRLAGEKAAEVLATKDLEVLCLAVDARDNVFAACAPSGAIYRIPPDGKPARFCYAGQSYVWSMAFTKKGDLFAATGPDGKLLRIRADGKTVETVIDSDDKHLLAVAAVGNTVYASSSGSGLVYRVAADGTVSIAFDADQSELRSMAAAPDGSVYVGTADGIQPSARKVPKRGKPSGGGSAGRSGSAMMTKPPAASETTKRPPESTPSKRPGGTGVSGTNVIYRIAPGGKVSPILKQKGMAFLSMAWHDGALLVATAGGGRLLRVAADGDLAVLAELEPPQLLSVCAVRNRVFVGTGNDGRVLVASADRAKSGTYTSDVYDARVRCRWGACHVAGSVPGGTRVEVATRTGNAAKPDKTWSAWSKPQLVAGRAVVRSPAARFIQYRLILSTRDAAKTPRVREVRLAFLADNYAPSVESIEIAPPKPKRGAPPPASAAGVVSGTVNVSWKANDPNGDTLEYELLFRGKGEKSWKRLEHELKDAKFEWDTQAAPDGVYRLLVRATDRPDNPAPRTLRGELVSEPFVVDNTPPVVQVQRREVRNGRCSVGIAATDAGSGLTRARYSVDAGPWQALLPADGIFDARDEAFTFDTKRLDAGEHTLAVQVWDSAGNVGSAKAVFEVPQR